MSPKDFIKYSKDHWSLAWKRINCFGDFRLVLICLGLLFCRSCYTPFWLSTSLSLSLYISQSPSFSHSLLLSLTTVSPLSLTLSPLSHSILPSLKLSSFSHSVFLSRSPPSLTPYFILSLTLSSFSPSLQPSLSFYLTLLLFRSQQSFFRKLSNDKKNGLLWKHFSVWMRLNKRSGSKEVEQTFRYR